MFQGTLTLFNDFLGTEEALWGKFVILALWINLTWLHNCLTETEFEHNISVPSQIMQQDKRPD